VFEVFGRVADSSTIWGEMDNGSAIWGKWPMNLSFGRFSQCSNYLHSSFSSLSFIKFNQR
jgi:hypothetical protein